MHPSIYWIWILPLMLTESLTSVNAKFESCGGIVTENNTQISPPMHPEITHLYRQNVKCTWTIKAPENYVIRLRFYRFELEYDAVCQYDYVLVEHAAVGSGRYCGGSPPPVITSLNNTLILKFSADGAESHTGFTAGIEFLEPTKGKVCGGIVTENNTQISPPSHPEQHGVYQHNLYCTWTIKAPENYVIQLRFHRFQLEYHASCESDYVLIEDPAGDSKRYCGFSPSRLVPPPVITSLNNTLILKFVTDGTLSLEGFTAEIRFLEPTKGCGGIVTENNTQISPPRHPEEHGIYQHNVSCTWTIKAPEKHIIRLTFTDFSLEYDTACQNDYVLIEDPAGDNERYCGRPPAPPPVITSVNNTLILKFVADGSESYGGFTAEIQFLVPTKGCGGIVTENNTQISPPRHPEVHGVYQNSVSCTWTIKAPEEHIIQLTFSDFSLEHQSECRSDYVLIEDPAGDSERYCGIRPMSSAPPPVITSLNNTLILKFVADGSLSFEGFTAEIKFLVPTKGSTTTTKPTAGYSISYSTVTTEEMSTRFATPLLTEESTQDQLRSSSSDEILYDIRDSLTYYGKISGMIFGLLVLLIIAICLVGFSVYKQCLRGKITGLNFVNPVYKKQTEGQDRNLESSVEKERTSDFLI